MGLWPCFVLCTTFWLSFPCLQINPVLPDTKATYVTIVDGFKHRPHLNELVAMCIEFEVCLYFLLQVMGLSLGVFKFHVYVTLDLSLHIFYFLVVNGIFLHYRFSYVNSFKFHDTLPWICAQTNTYGLEKCNVLPRKVRRQYLEWDVCADPIYSSCGEYPLSLLGRLYPFICQKPHLDVTMTPCGSVVTGKWWSPQPKYLEVCSVHL